MPAGVPQEQKLNKNGLRRFRKLFWKRKDIKKIFHIHKLCTHYISGVEITNKVLQYTCFETTDNELHLSFPNKSPHFSIKRKCFLPILPFLEFQSRYFHHFALFKFLFSIHNLHVTFHTRTQMGFADRLQRLAFHGSYFVADPHNSIRPRFHPHILIVIGKCLRSFAL